MTTSTETRSLDRPAEVFSQQEEFTLIGFLAGYSGLTLEAYRLDLRQYVEWCAERTRPALRCTRTSRSSAATSRRSGEPVQRLLGGSALSRASTATRNKKGSSLGPQP